MEFLETFEKTCLQLQFSELQTRKAAELVKKKKNQKKNQKRKFNILFFFSKGSYSMA